MFSNGIKPRPLLDQSLVLQTRDADEAASLLALSAVPYRAEVLSSPLSFATKIFGAQDPKTSLRLTRVKTSGVMHVRACLPEDSYVIVLALSGDVEHRVANDIVHVRPGSAFVENPKQGVDVRTPEAFELLFVRFSSEELAKQMQMMLQHEITAPLRFSPQFELGTVAGQHFRQLLLHLCVQLEQNPLNVVGFDELRKPELNLRELGTVSLEAKLITLLAESQSHNYTRMISRSLDTGPWHLRAAEEYISANSHLPISLGDICAAAGVNSRTLQHNFQKKRGHGPMEFLRTIRFERVRDELLSPDRNTTVTGAACGWGFTHFGRFAQEYRIRFGERPSESLRRGRRKS